MIPLIKIKRAYEKPFKKDGFRVLVDRLWPRGVTKENANVDEWARELALTPALRKWFGHEPILWPDFQKRYKAELKRNTAVGDFIDKHKDKKTITLIYAAKDELHNHAVVLKAYIESCFAV